MTRSNRQLTQFAVDKLHQFLTIGPESFQAEEAGNTRVSFHSCTKCPRSTVKFCLFDKLILELIFSSSKPTVVSGLVIRAGDFYDSLGRPSRTTRERLNGLLDALGDAHFLPQNIRVFLREDGSCHLGKGEASKPFDKANSVLEMLAHPNDMVFT